ncbi:hypothetical protein H5410_039378 [Solanum commersonii]|uniref:Uncharacterized protein n=1 Tax=Solanum commersonii TaxID=4109 RepID=A0A9J5YD73_SOLCO|nr:hypothetical protein H5410_039378 [Solanum commersonii]
MGGRNSGSAINPWIIAHENRQNGGFTCSEARLTLKMGRFSPYENWKNEGFTCSEARLTLKMGRFGCEGQLTP